MHRRRQIFRKIAHDAIEIRYVCRMPDAREFGLCCNAQHAPGALLMDSRLLDILVCPVCKTPVKMLADGSGLKCQQCKRVYPIRDDIPVMLPEEAKIVND